jgi:hypothetical protein
MKPDRPRRGLDRLDWVYLGIVVASLAVAVTLALCSG